MTESVKYECKDALSIVHRGPYDTLSESYGRLWGEVLARELPGDMFEREIYVIEGETPQEHVTEIHVPLHRWHDLLAEGVERVLGATARAEVMQGVEAARPDAAPERRAAWLQAATRRLEALANDEQRREILWRCAHIFPQERI